MNPSLLGHLDATWQNDTREGWMKDRFGGEAVPVDEPEPPPIPPDENDGCIRIAASLVVALAWVAYVVIIRIL